MRFFRVNGAPAVMMRVARLPGPTRLRTAREVAGRGLEELRARPPGRHPLSDLSDESVRLARTAGRSAASGAPSPSAGSCWCSRSRCGRPAPCIMVLASAVVAVAGTTLGLYLLGIPANLLTLAGLGMGVGILVQDGLIVVDRLRTAPDTPEGRAAAGRKITPAVLGSTLTTAVVLFPFLYLQGDARAAFMPFAAAFSMALGFSIITSVVMIPAIGAGHRDRVVRWPRLRRSYLHIVIRLLRWRWTTITVTVLLLAGLGYVFAAKVPRSSFAGWWNQRTTLSARVDFPSGSDPASVDQSVKDLERIVVGRNGVENVQAQGDADGGFVVVTFDDDAAFTAIPLQMQEEVTQRAVLIGGASVSVSGRGPGFFNGGGSASLATFRVKILGYSFAGVEQLALDLKARLERIPRVKSVDINAAGFWFGRSGPAMSRWFPIAPPWRATDSMRPSSPRR